MTADLNPNIAPEKAAQVVRDCGGEDLTACLTCQECAPLCFLNEYYPGTTPRTITTNLLEGRVQELSDSEFIWACTLCGRCTVDCPKGLQMDSIVRKLRGVSRERGKGPKRLEEGLQMIKDTGNSVGIDEEEFRDTLQWLGEEAASEIEGLEEDEFEVPIDKEGAEFLYVPNPREYTSAASMFSLYLKFFVTVDADWTFASNLRDISNWAYYMGDEETNLKLVSTIVETARRLGVKALVSTECGHGYKILRKDAERMVGEPLGFEVVSIVELANRYFREGRLRLRKGAIEESVTYHDPCNVGRKLSVYEAPRALLKHVATDYVEMFPDPRHTICCGGGGNVVQNTEMGVKRLEHARAIHEKILATGAKICTTSCQACLTQLNDLKAHYKMPVEMKTVMELVMASVEE